MISILTDADLCDIGLSNDAIRNAVEAGLIAQADGSALAEPTSVFNPTPGADDLIAVIRGALPEQRLALVKTVGGFSGNAAKGLATNPGLLTLIETDTGQTTGLLPASRITSERTAMVTAIGATRLAHPEARVLGCIGTGGISVLSTRYIAAALPLDEIRLHGRDPSRTQAAAEQLQKDIGVPVVATPDWESCMSRADIMIDGSALPNNRALFPADVMAPGCLLIVFGAYSSLPVGITAHIDRLVMDRWVPDGRGGLGPHTTSGEISEATLSALIGDVIAGKATGRHSPSDRVLFCHRGVAACDLMLAQAYLSAAAHKGLGTRLAL
ncbi:hypothetical protein [uncultured Tateyamaria sp.]|uniref:hypothetical protein n=1 Tax=uncultured Tateyamaria sp. TaxID=455651 RepID=UPI0026252292|nr:hypothetical protein [uncultured Tateyamaria sp.]